MSNPRNASIDWRRWGVGDGVIAGVGVDIDEALWEKINSDGVE
ncbi:MAG: hypothetical protein U0929_14850 [Planctomycetaceae bacterium]